MANNRSRILGEVLSLDAWHEPFDISGGSSAVFVELSFHEGRMGGSEADFPFTFKIALKRALVTISLEAPLEIDRKSVARSVPETQIELTRLRAAKDAAIAKAGASGKLSPAVLHLALTGSVARASEVSAEDQIKVVQTVPETLVSPRPASSHQYSWELEPTYRESLVGQPWDPIEPPRLRVKSPRQLGKLERTIRVDITCGLEDVIIDDLVPKKNDLGSWWKNSWNDAINHAAAVQHL